MTKQIAYEEFFRLPTILYKTLGFRLLHFSETNWLRYRRYLYVAYLIGSHLFCRYYMFKQLFVDVKQGDILHAINLGPYFTFTLDSNIKLIGFVFNWRRLRAVYATLLENYPTTAGEQRAYRVTQHYLSRKTRSTIYFYLMSSGAIIIGPLVQSLVLYIYQNPTLTDDTVRFTYLKTLPISYDYDYRTPGYYALTCVLEFGNCILVTCSDIGTDLYLICFAAQICMHLEYIANRLEEYEPRIENDQQDCDFLKDMIRKHQLMLDVNRQLNEIFGISLAFNFIATTALFCTTAAECSIIGFGVDFLKIGTFLIAGIGQIYFICYYGEQLIMTSKSISTAAFIHNWYNGSNRYKKLLMIIIIRSQKEANLLPKGFQPISLDTFRIIMTMTYRTFALLQSMIE